MNDSQLNELDMGQRVQVQMSHLSAHFPAGSRGAVLIDDLAAAITQAKQEAAKQVSATLDRQEGTEQKKAAINTLLERMRAINLTARSINHIRPGIAELFRMPRDNDQERLNRARAFITAATPIAAEFIERGLPVTFLDDLQAAIDAVGAAEDHQSVALIAQAAATAGLALALKQLIIIVRELDAIVRNLFRNDPGTLAAWESASHVKRAPRRTKKTTPPPPASQATAEPQG